MNNWTRKLRQLGKVEKTFGVLLLVYLVLLVAAPGSASGTMTGLALIGLAIWIAGRLALRGIRKAIWGLRNRLLVTYLFIGVVPVSLLLILAGLGGYAFFSQLAVYLAVSNLDRRTELIRDIAESLAITDPALRPELMRRVAEIHRHRLRDLQVTVRTPSGAQSWPKDTTAPAPVNGWGEVSGVAVRGGHYFLWANVQNGGTQVTATMPLSRRYLSEMVPGLGDVSLLDISDQQREKAPSVVDGKNLKSSREPPATSFPAPVNRFDIDVRWPSTVPVWRWEQPGKKDVTLLFVHTRPSAVLNTIINTKVDQVSEILPILLLIVAILFLIIEFISLIIGASLARTITRAVHNLYQGTQRVIEGDFASRIQVYGKDQLADLSASFNTMTENLERLLAVAKEKERLQAEIEIAREVQEQLYPKVMPAMRTMRLTAICQPARMVSGDYYDYLCVPDGRLALAIGDVSGKGISAALLMASLQSAMRMELRSTRAIAVSSGLVSDLNQQLYATTAPEKYATFFFALYDENTGELSYTNAGHLPPLLVRAGVAVPLEVSGTVVGAFPFSKYVENRIQMESGDLLVCYTDGITEPENEYGEEFGEERLVDVIVKHAERDDDGIVASVMEAVRQWTSSAEQPDDMTLLLARRV